MFILMNVFIMLRKKSRNLSSGCSTQEGKRKLHNYVFVKSNCENMMAKFARPIGLCLFFHRKLDIHIMPILPRIFVNLDQD